MEIGRDRLRVVQGASGLLLVDFLRPLWINQILAILAFHSEGRLVRQGLALQELNMNEHFRIHHHANDISNLC